MTANMSNINTAPQTNPTKCDIGFVIALREEFEQIEYLGGKGREAVNNERGLEIYRYQLALGGVTRSVYSILLDDQGPEAAAIGTAQFLQIFRPSLLVSLGISGRISNDCRLGDVVLASRCDNALYRAKIKKGGIRPAGREFKLDSLTRLLVTELSQNQPFYSYADLSPADLLVLRSNGLVGEAPKTHHGPVCATPFLIDDPQFVDWIKDSRNRTILATDMESAAIVQAADAFGIRDGRMLVIRGISDPADGNKESIDRIEGGALRKVAMRNASTLAHHCLSNFIKFTEHGCEIASTVDETNGGALGYVEIRRALSSFSTALANGDDEKSVCREMDAQIQSIRSLKQQFREVALAIFKLEIDKEDTRIAREIGLLEPIQRDYLVAAWVMNCLVHPSGKLDEINYDTLSNVYPQRVNRFCKAMLSNISDETKLVDALIAAFQSKKRTVNSRNKQNSERVKAHVCYLLGRVRTIQKKRAIESLLRWRDSMGKTPQGYRLSDKGNYQIERIFSSLRTDGERLLFRTICISLILLGHNDEAEIYVKACIRSKPFDSLNRGFHLEYYGDIEYDPRESMNNVDDLGSCRLTFNKLYIKLSDSYLSKSNYALRDIELQTILSLIQQRFAAKKLDDDMREKIVGLLSMYPSLQLTSIPILRSYCDLLRDHFVQHDFSRSSLVKKLYELKKLPRSGWNSIKDGRSNPNPESVMSHTGGGLLLIQFFLPEALSEADKEVLGRDYCAGYSKNQIFKMFLLHDLAEAYTGDLLPKQKHYPAIEEESRINSFIDLFSTYPGFEQFSHFRICSEFERASTINARIAREIDLLDNLVQLIVERSDVNVVIPDYQEWVSYIVVRITTPIGKRILEMLLH
jgi:nucleoside phosphorylase/5'-deoxynucleotidase YfbR-like HD superfamily hydrolase